MKSSSKIAVTSKIELLHLSTALGVNNFQDEKEIRDAVIDFSDSQRAILTDIWAEIAGMANNHFEQGVYTLNGSVLERKLDLVETFADIAQSNLVKINQSDDERAMQLTKQYDDESSALDITKDFRGIAESIEGKIDKPEPDYSGLELEDMLSQLLAEDPEAVRSDDDSKRVSSVIGLIDNLIVNSQSHGDKLNAAIRYCSNQMLSDTKLSSSGKIAINKSDIIDSDGDLSLVKVESADVFNGLALASDGGLMVLKDLHRAHKKGADVSGAIMMGKIDVDGGFEPMLLTPFSKSNMEKDDRSSLSRAIKIKASEDPHHSDSISMGRLVSRNVDLLGFVLDDANATVDNLIKSFRVPVPLNYKVSHLSGEPPSLIDLCIATTLCSKGATRRNGEDVIDFDREAVNASMHAFETEYLLSTMTLSVDSISDSLCSSGIDGMIANNLLPTCDNQRRDLLAQAVKNVVSSVNEKYGDTMCDRFSSKSELSSIWIKNASSHLATDIGGLTKSLSREVKSIVALRYELTLKQGVDAEIISELKSIVMSASSNKMENDQAKAEVNQCVVDKHQQRVLPPKM
jgi:hypothetical protein